MFWTSSATITAIDANTRASGYGSLGDDMANQSVVLIVAPDLLTICHADGTVHAVVPWPAPRPTKQSTINLRKPPHRIAPPPPNPSPEVSPK